ncbi:hypothetical protein AM588_10005350 [Phytophthora nicotianae]|uniref:Temptin Cys/Cys disulfide domain-containing protein n=1 Tax=Phytophthora nicotianae TaxID=4792 RepID=A0A0W8DGN7_PHYNI|nr:hypothetical protein AM588_10005350 [Phytophthora nicotianae]
MKTCLALVATTLIVASTFDSVVGLAKYLDELPNGSSFSQELGHPDKDSSKFTDFATAFADAGHSWTAEFCAKTFPGASMTNGEAFGDPCCTWKKGGTPDFTVTAFTTSPTKATTCASTSQTSTASSTAASTASSTAASSAGSSTSTTTDAPVTTDAPATTDVPASTDAPAATDAPASPTMPSTPSGGCAAKGAGGKGQSKGSYSFRH